MNRMATKGKLFVVYNRKNTEKGKGKISNVEGSYADILKSHATIANPQENKQYSTNTAPVCLQERQATALSMEEYPALNSQETRHNKTGGNPTKTSQEISKTILDNTLQATVIKGYCCRQGFST
eukprot:7059392-Ditylum_brightwellii.AAC.1